jgi:hypothetical protein
MARQWSAGPYDLLFNERKAPDGTVVGGKDCGRWLTA